MHKGTRLADRIRHLRAPTAADWQGARALPLHKPRLLSLLTAALAAAGFVEGFMGLEVGASEGGSGMTFADSLMVIEELSRVDPSVGLFVGIHVSLICCCYLFRP